MRPVDRLWTGLLRRAVIVELDDIQATVLRYRPEPYYGTHVMPHVEDARAGGEFLRDVTPHVASAAHWWQADEPWIAVGITYSGLVALGLPEDSLQSFVRYSPEIETIDPDFEEYMARIIDFWEKTVRESPTQEGTGRAVRGAHAKTLGLEPTAL